MTSDIRDFVQRRVHFFRVYEHALTDLVRSSLRVGDGFIDIGANVGYFSLLAGRLVGEQGKVLAIEADPEIHAALVHNINLNPGLPIETRQVAITRERCRVSMKLEDARNLGSSVVHVGDGDISGLPLQEVAGPALAAANFVKVDVEGAEAPILDVLLDALPRMPERLTIAVELQDDQAAYIERFAEAGFDCHLLPNRYAIEYYLLRATRLFGDKADLLRPTSGYEPGHHDYVLVRRASTEATVGGS